jgi:catechol-2,3-dioxygenase
MNEDGSNAIAVASIAHLVVTVADCHEAIGFYARLFGLVGLEGDDLLPGCGHHRVLRLPSGQRLVLTEPAERPDPTRPGMHQAYRIGRSRREAIRARLAARQIEIDSEQQDRPEEAADTFYFRDPDGNRVQLVTGDGNPKLPCIDHACIPLVDLRQAEHFYGGELGLAVTQRGADKQLFFHAGDAMLGICLGDTKDPAPPVDQLVGAPRIALATSRTELDRAAARLRSHGLPLLGPILHPDSAPLEASLYFTDGGGNFLELCALRRS